MIDHADEAFSIVSSALQLGKAFVSANKKMIAKHFVELMALQEFSNISFLYKGAVGGSLPVIRNLEEYYDNEMLKGIYGIVNASTNFILTIMQGEKYSYEEALAQAQTLGFAERDPSFDVGGYDAVNKLSILLAHAYGIVLSPADILFKGITQLRKDDAKFADEKGYKIKLTVQAHKLTNGEVVAFVMPQFVTSEHLLYSVHNEYNGVVIESLLADKQFLYGKGAGSNAISSAILSDISALRYDYRYTFKKLRRSDKTSLCSNYYLRIYVSFDDRVDINKADFEIIEEFRSLQDRRYLIGIIHAAKLEAIIWFSHPQVSTVVMPNGIIEKDAFISKNAEVIIQLDKVSAKEISQRNGRKTRK